MSRFDSARNSINLISAAVRIVVGIVEDDILGINLKSLCAGGSFSPKASQDYELEDPKCCLARLPSTRLRLRFLGSIVGCLAVIVVATNIVQRGESDLSRFYREAVSELNVAFFFEADTWLRRQASGTFTICFRKTRLPGHPGRSVDQ